MERYTSVAAGGIPAVRRTFKAAAALTGLDGARDLLDDGFGALHGARLAAGEQPQVPAAGDDPEVLHGGAVLDDGRHDVAVAARERYRFLRGDLRLAISAGAAQQLDRDARLVAHQGLRPAIADHDRGLSGIALDLEPRRLALDHL